MYRVVITIFFLPFLSFNQVNFEEDFSVALNKAKEKDKFLFVEYYNPNCHFCQELEPFFEDKEMGEFYNKYFVNYKMNSLELSELEQKFLDQSNLKSMGVPTFLFFDSDGDFMHYGQTQRDVDFLIGIGKSALNSFARAAGLEEKYKDGDRTVRTLYAYCNLLKMYEDDSLVRQVAADLFDAFDEDKLSTRKSYMVLNKCVNHPSNGFFKYWVNRLEKLEEVSELKNDRHLHLMQRIVRNSINNDEFNSIEQLEEIKKYVKITELSDNPDNYLWKQRVELLAQENNEEEALEIVLKVAETGKSNSASVIYSLEHGFKHLNDQINRDKLFKKLSTLDPRTMNYRIQLKYYYLEYRYFSHKNDAKNTKSTLSKLEDIATKNKLTSQKVNDFLGEEILDF